MTETPADLPPQNRAVFHPEPTGGGFWIIPLMECFLQFDEDNITDLLPAPRSYGWDTEAMNLWAWGENRYKFTDFVPDFNRYGCLPIWFPTTDQENRPLTPQGQIDRFLCLVEAVYGHLPDDHRRANPQWLADAILTLMDDMGTYTEFEEGMTWELEENE